MQKAKISKAILKKMNKTGELSLADININYKVTVNKVV